VTLRKRLFSYSKIHYTLFSVLFQVPTSGSGLSAQIPHFVLSGQLFHEPLSFFGVFYEKPTKKSPFSGKKLFTHNRFRGILSIRYFYMKNTIRAGTNRSALNLKGGYVTWQEK